MNPLTYQLHKALERLHFSAKTTASVLSKIRQEDARVQSGSSGRPGESFDQVLGNSIDEVFRYTLGEGGARSIKFHLNLNQYWENPKEFHESLFSLLKEGALVLESLVVKELFRRLDMQYEEPRRIDFVKLIASARKSYDTENRRAAK